MTPEDTFNPGLVSDIQVRFENILSFDFEAVPNGNTYHIGAVFKDKTFQRKEIKQLKAALADLSEFSKDADYILGHNIINHDLPVAGDAFPEAGFLNLPVIDTLFLSPLAFPENPYHKLVKDYKLVKNSKNDPIADAKLARVIFEDQMAALCALRRREPGLSAFYAFAFKNICSGNERFGLKGIFDLFHFLAGKVPDRKEAKIIFQDLSRGKVCRTGLGEIWEEYSGLAAKRPVLAYVLSWIMVSGGNSIIPPWVKHEYPEIPGIIRKLRYSCSDEGCAFCREHNDSEKLLKKYFGFETYRALADGRQLQKQIIDSNLNGSPLLGILPTGGGKSICYQVPALHRHDRLGELTIVISPLKALMKDQVDNLNRTTGTETAAAINGSLTLPERGAVMERVRLGDIGILYLSPEQMRNFSVAQLIKSRNVGCWVFDEAHCLSKWGHDFRPDYLHVSEFIAGYSRNSGNSPLVGAFTATAKKDVIEEILSHFTEKLSIDLECFIGGVQRENLNFQVWPVTENEKYDVIFNCLKEIFADRKGGAIVYCSKRKNTEDLSGFLNEKGIFCEAFHAGRSEPDKKNIQDDFVEGKIPVICATNAFGMGIDKKDIRLVIHADIPGSLENYLQEAGRAGRDMEPSDCILLYEQEDIENQFSLNAYSKLSIKDIKKILGLLKKRGAKTPEIIITPGEIMRLIGYEDFGGNDARASIGVSWLERKGFVERSFNQTLFFKGTPAVKNMEEAAKKIEKLNLSKIMRAVFITILNFLFNADSNTLLSADEICVALGKIKDLPEKYLDSRHVITLLSDMANAGLIREGVVMTAFVKPKGKGSSPKSFEYFAEIEKQMIKIMEEMAPDSYLSPDRADVFNLRLMSQRLKDSEFKNINADTVERILRSIANDKGESLGKSMKISGRRGVDQLQVYVKFSWQEIKKRIELRHQASRVILTTIISCLPINLRKGQAQVLAEFFVTDIMDAMKTDVFLSGFKGDIRPLIERSLLYLHDVKIITLQNGLGVFRQAMTITMLPGTRKRQYTKGDYEPLSHHYAQKNVQVHVMEKFARLGLEKIKTALNFVSDYFSFSYDSFISQYFPDEKEIIQTAMTAEAYKKIIQSLENSIQETIVASPPEKNMLVLAGPGSGKTKTIVHRCAWLIKAKS
ncbi:MAG: RecQ family ATP-dependent DNA helicase, partial [Desulfobacula sp.]|uniref:RecQ family ATP-dependent DNA helicase n=1 Tax=Desulfobacula sp. TaxID=2593537 RepID=UPI0025BCB9EB